MLDKTIGILKMFVNRKLFLFVRAILDHPRLKIGLKAVMNGSSKTHKPLLFNRLTDFFGGNGT